MNNINWVEIRARIQEAILALPHFIKNPVQTMKDPPHWDWPTQLILQGGFVALCSFASGLIERRWLRALTGIFIAPISNLLLCTIAAGLFYYVFLFWFQREFKFRQIYLLVLFAAIPSQIVSVVSGLFPPIQLVGLAATTWLLFIGFSENLGLERQRLRQLLVGMFAICLVYYGWHAYVQTQKREHQREKATPESLDILEKELNFDN
jgi:high-affinity Fe2+/Pb2+ permease